MFRAMKLALQDIEIIDKTLHGKFWCWVVKSEGKLLLYEMVVYPTIKDIRAILKDRIITHKGYGQIVTNGKIHYKYLGQ